MPKKVREINEWIKYGLSLGLFFQFAEKKKEKVD